MREGDARAISAARNHGSSSAASGETVAAQLLSESQARLPLSDKLPSPTDESDMVLLLSESHARPSSTDAMDMLSLPPDSHATLLSLASPPPRARLPDPRLPDP